MRKLMPLLACLMLVLTSWSGMAHTAEASARSMAGVEFAVHAAGDGDEVPADGDNGRPHHHGVCHGHDIGTAMPFLGEMPYIREAGVCGRRTQHALVPADQSRSLRPPQA